MNASAIQQLLASMNYVPCSKPETEDNNPPLPSTSVTEELKLEPEGEKASRIINDSEIFILELLFFVCFSIIYGFFGIVTNIINLVVFIKQGLFSGGSTLNLFFLAIADLGVSGTIFLWGLGYSFVVAKIRTLPVAPFAVVFFSFCWPNAVLTTLNRMLTAYVAFERCMCVVIPFKVRHFFTPRKNLFYIILIYAYVFLSHIPIYMVHELGEVQVEGSNSTQLDLVFGPNREFWHDLVYYGNYLALSILTAVIVMVCTVITSAYIRTSKEWRNKVSTATNNTKSTAEKEDGCYDNNGDKKLTKSAMDKETRLIKMITTISVIFCICYIPELALIVIRSIEPRINMGFQYERLSLVLHVVKFHAATVNSGINIFVYYRMSSKYKQIFLSLFGRNKNKDKA